jgi:DNA-directed RNA polymerase subunit omega
MIIPLDYLESEEGNMYELTCAAIRRAYQLTVTGDTDSEEEQAKIVSSAIKQILTRKVQYRIEE